MDTYIPESYNRNLMRTFLLFAALFIGLTAYGQDARLAQQYFQNGEYEKAAVLYERLFSLNEENDFYLNRYVDSLLAVEAYEE